jgi:anti-sigma B factor antagonist
MTVMRTLTIYQCDNRATIFLEGEIDLATAPALVAAVRACLSREAVHVDVDLARLTFCDASGVNAFLAASRSLEASGGRLRLRHPTPAVRRVFDVTGTAFLFRRSGAAAPSALRARGDEPVPPAPGRPAASGDH